MGKCAIANEGQRKYAKRPLRSWGGGDGGVANNKFYFMEENEGKSGSMLHSKK